MIFPWEWTLSVHVPWVNFGMTKWASLTTGVLLTVNPGSWGGVPAYALKDKNKTAPRRAKIRPS